jgi:hypothetical protein
MADVVAEVRDGRLDDFVREAVALVAQQLMEAEINSEVGAESRRGRARGTIDVSERGPPGVGGQGR